MFKKISTGFRYLASIFVLFPSCKGQEANFSQMVDGLIRLSVDTISAETAYKKKDNYLFLDARSREEYAVSRTPGAVWVGYKEFSKEVLADLPKNKEVVVYCSVGYRSEKIGEQLEQANFPKVLNLYGGVFDWVNKGLPLENENGKTSNIHPYDKSWGKWLEKGNKVLSH